MCILGELLLVVCTPSLSWSFGSCTSLNPKPPKPLWESTVELLGLFMGAPIFVVSRPYPCSWCMGLYGVSGLGLSLFGVYVWVYRDYGTMLGLYGL